MRSSRSPREPSCSVVKADRTRHRKEPRSRHTYSSRLITSTSTTSTQSSAEHAKQCGAHIVQPPTDMPFGERVYTARDHEGHWWTFSQHIADVAPEEWGAKTPGGN